MDAMLSKAAQQFLPSASGSLVDKSAEFKPLSRKGIEFGKLVQDGQNQNLGHNLQVLWDSCYQFCGGLGKDGEASGIVLTMISANVMSSSLSGVGTEEVKLDISSTKNLALFSKATTKVLLEGSGQAVESLNLTFEDNGQVMQPGFKALVHFIIDEGSHKSEITFESSDVTVKEYLGSGAFCSVYKCEERDSKNSLVLKMGKNVFDRATLDRELEALKKLDHEGIPKLYKEDLFYMTVKARCEANVVPCLLLNLDIGVSVRQLCRDAISHIQGFIQELFDAIRAVLDYAHEKGWIHLDVQPSNIIVVRNDDGTRRYVLIDWGTAVQGGNKAKKLEYFRGTPPFADQQLLLIKKSEKDTWKGQKPKAEFDKFSMAMTLAYIQHGGVPWYGFHRPVVTDAMLSDRLTKAVELIQKSGLDPETKEEVISWLPRRGKRKRQNP
mmetsp:Transcript_83237/g.124839  ORF Transcript_83237/g.124839 Transcript_83237/m.124839 type:complete len:439 (+) Transcript_83237:442-1758(+)